MKRAREEMKRRFAGEPEPVLTAVIAALLTGNPTATVLLGQHNPKQVEATANAAARAWVRRVYFG